MQLDPYKAYRRRKKWIKVPPGHDLFEEPSDGGVEEHFVPPVETPICCGGTPAAEDPSEEFSDRVCPQCKARWYP